MKTRTKALAGAAALCLAAAGVVLAVANREGDPADFDPRTVPWRETKACEQVPFSVGFRHMHPYLPEYLRRVSFKSGKVASLGFDTGGAGGFAVYALPDGTLLLMDGLRSVQHRGKYLVDVRKETVACMPAKSEQKCKRYLGLVTTAGTLVLGGPEPKIQSGDDDIDDVRGSWERNERDGREFRVGQ